MSSQPTLLHEVSTIETPEQIEVDLPLAGVSTRALAYIIDFLWQLLPIIIAAIVAFLLLPETVRPGEFLDRASGQIKIPLYALAFVSAVIFVVNFGYFFFFEVLWGGQSPGKRLFNLRVIRDGGYPIDARSSLVRNLLRTVDILPAFYFLGIAILFAGRKGKRIGDYAAGTIVVIERKPDLYTAVVEPTIGSGRLSAAEQSVMTRFMVRRFDLAVEARSHLAREIADRLAIRLGEPSPPDAEYFLEKLQSDARG